MHNQYALLKIACVLTVAVHAGVGHMAVQLAKALGLYVVGVAGPTNAEWVKQHLGADEVVDYKKQVGEVYYTSSTVLCTIRLMCCTMQHCS